MVCPLLHEAGLRVKVPSYFPLMDYGGSEQISIYGYFGKVLHVHRPSTKEIVINRVSLTKRLLLCCGVALWPNAVRP